MAALTHSSDGSPGDAPGLPTLAGADRAAELTASASRRPSFTLTPAQLADLELLLLGVFGRVPGYAERPLRDGLRTPSLLVSAEQAKEIAPGDTVALRDADGTMIAALRVGAACPSEAPNQNEPEGEAEATSPAGPRQVRLAGRVEGLRLPPHPDYPGLRLRPAQLRGLLLERGWIEPGGRPPWAVWADGLLHTADIARIRALTRQGKRCVVLAPTGGADPADPHHHLRVRALRAALDALDQPVRPTEATLTGAAIAAEATRGSAAVAAAMTAYPPGPPTADARAAGGELRRAPDAQPARALLVLVPIIPSPELAAPREPGITATSPSGSPIGGDAGAPDRLAELTTLRAHVAEVYGLGGSITGPALGAPERDELSRLLAAGRRIPAELTPPGVAAELARAYPPRHARGFVVVMTGPPGPGASELARLLTVRLLERGDRHVTLLDGGLAPGRPELARGADESAGKQAGGDGGPLTAARLVAEVAAAGGVVVCAPATPRSAWTRIRALAGSTGAGFMLVHVPPSAATLDHRGAEGAASSGHGAESSQARRPGGEQADLGVTVDPARLGPGGAVDAVLDRLRAEGWLPD